MEWQDSLFRQVSNQTKVKLKENALVLYTHCYLEWHKGMRDQLQRASFLHSTHGLLNQARYIMSCTGAESNSNPSLYPPWPSSLLAPGQKLLCSLLYPEYLLLCSQQTMHLREGMEMPRIRVMWWYPSYICILHWASKKHQQNKQKPLGLWVFSQNSIKMFN